MRIIEPYLIIDLKVFSYDVLVVKGLGLLYRSIHSRLHCGLAPLTLEAGEIEHLDSPILSMLNLNRKVMRFLKNEQKRRHLNGCLVSCPIQWVSDNMQFIQEIIRMIITN